MMAQRRGQSNLSPLFRVNLTSPTTGTTYTTTSNAVSLSGTAEDATTSGVTSVSWTNLSRNPNTSGGAGGTNNWIANYLSLQPGSNLIRILATGGVYSSPNNGNTTFSRTVNVSYNQPGGDVAVPVVVINGPTANPGYGTHSTTVNLNGTASDNVGVSSVEWASDRGGNGLAAGTTSWQANGISLQVGINVISVAARDANNNVGVDTLTVVYAPPGTNLAPLVNAGSDQNFNLTPGATLALAGIVEDDGLPLSAAVTSTWSQVSGPGVVSFGNANNPNTTVSFSAAGTYVLRLTANDTNLSGSDEMAVTVFSPGSNPIRIDFGDSSNPTAGNWNNVSSNSVGLKISDMKDISGALTGLGLFQVSAFTGSNTAGSTNANGVYPVSATSDSFYTQDATIGKVRLQGLNVSAKYNLTFYGSRIATDSANRLCRYSVGTSFVTLNAHNNETAVAKLNNLVPAADGTIEVQVRNSNNSGFAYLGVLELQIANQAPLVSAGSNQTITLPVSATLTGNVSDDGLPSGSLTQTWTKVSGPDIVNFGNANAANTTASFVAAGTYVLRLSATDSVLSGSSDVTITVGAAVSGYSFWQSQQLWNGGDSSPMGDPDGDGLTNVVEYALGLNPTTAGTAGWPTAQTVGGNLIYRYNKDNSKSDISYQVEASTDLENWSPVDSTLNGPGGTIETWAATIPMDGVKKFVRLRINQ
jgi:hypothetical protein